MPWPLTRELLRARTVSPASFWSSSRGVVTFDESSSSWCPRCVALPPAVPVHALALEVRLPVGEAGLENPLHGERHGRASDRLARRDGPRRDGRDRSDGEEGRARPRRECRLQARPRRPLGESSQGPPALLMLSSSFLRASAFFFSSFFFLLLAETSSPPGWRASSAWASFS